MTRAHVVPLAARLGAAALCLPLLLGACSGDDDGDGATPTASARPLPSGAPAGPPPPVETGAPSVGISTLPAVPVGETAALKQGVRVTVSRVRPTEVKANGPGDIAGAGAAVAVTVDNRTSAGFDLGGLVVTASYDRDKPASPGGAGNGTPLEGTLKAGATAKGTYVFSVPAASLASLEVQVSSDSSPNVLVFVK
jgi:hypothetical protein